MNLKLGDRIRFKKDAFIASLTRVRGMWGTVRSDNNKTWTVIDMEDGTQFQLHESDHNTIEIRTTPKENEIDTKVPTLPTPTCQHSPRTVQLFTSTVTECSKCGVTL